VSNFFISNPKAPNADSLIRFTLRARNDTLWTPARKAMIFKDYGIDTKCTCGNRRFCDLLHILNNCAYNLKEMTMRHNMIQEVLVEAIIKHTKISTDETLTNKGINYGKFQKELGKRKLDENEEKQRPDIQFRTDVSNEEDKFETWKLYIIEISVPFGKGDQEDEHSNTLKNVIEFKTNKYAPLIRSINKQLKEKKAGKRKFIIEFIPFIISSLGSLPNKSIYGITKIIGTTTNNTIGL
jgi:hypothetical protein